MKKIPQIIFLILILCILLFALIEGVVMEVQTAILGKESESSTMYASAETSGNSAFCYIVV